MEKTAPTPSVSLVILNFNGREHLAECLPSVLRLEYPAAKLEVIVCDNGSSDGSADYVRTNFPGVRLIELDHNHGFAEGNDLAAREADAEWVGFLNNDIWVPPDWLRKLLGPLEERPEIGSLASRIANWDGSRIDFVGGGANFQGYGYQHDSGAERSDRDREGPVLFACGGAMLVRRELFLEVGGFDPEYFIYYEDVDLGWRLNLLGHTVWYAPAASVNHRHHGTTASWLDHRKQVLYDRNALYTMYKNLDEANLAVAWPASLLLLNEKAIRSGGIPVEDYRMGPSPSLPYELHETEIAPRPSALTRARRVFGEEGPRALVEKAARRLPLHPNDVLVPKPGLSPLVAISQFAHGLESLGVKRRWIQSRRQRSDEEILPLLHYSLFPAHFEPRYINFHNYLRKVMALDARFAGGHDVD